MHKKDEETDSNSNKSNSDNDTLRYLIDLQEAQVKSNFPIESTLK